ncbi:MAG: TraR/DksA family transcriptional regulator [Candidatus Methylomirabilales bacterium]
MRQTRSTGRDRRASALRRIQAARQALRVRVAAARDAGPARPIELMDGVQQAVVAGPTAAAQRLLARLEALAQAEARWRDGRYGVCEACGEAIPARRLAALPEARHCVACAEAREADGTGLVTAV